MYIQVSPLSPVTLMTDIPSSLNGGEASLKGWEYFFRKLPHPLLT